MKQRVKIKCEDSFLRLDISMSIQNKDALNRDELASLRERVTDHIFDGLMKRFHASKIHVQ